MKRLILGLTFVFYVVTYNGRVVAGPFALLDDCNAIARVMHAQNALVRPFCGSGTGE